MGWGEKLEDDIDLDPPSMRQAIAWSFALRNIRKLEAEEARQQLLKSTGAESVRDVKAGLNHTLQLFCARAQIFTQGNNLTKILWPSTAK